MLSQHKTDVFRWIEERADEEESEPEEETSLSPTKRAEV